MSEPDDQDRKLSGRRQAIKAVTLAGLATSATLLPDSWTKPILRSIIVPAHAQVTPPG